MLRAPAAHSRPSAMRTCPTATRTARSIAVALVVLALAACSSTRLYSCRAGEDLVVTDSLYFGTAKEGGSVTHGEWQYFLATTVTPRFPQGITSWLAAGQWRGADGQLQHESSYVLQLVHADTPQTEQAVRDVIEGYRKKFAQEAVLRVRQPSCITL